MKSRKTYVRGFSLFVAVIMIFTMMSVLSAKEVSIGYTKGFIASIEKIDPDDPEFADWISISDRAGLEAIAGKLDGKYYLTNDIDLSGKEWVPIGSDCYNCNHYINYNDFNVSVGKFAGILDGQGYVIRNLTITGDHRHSVGLFRSAEKAVVRNIGMEDTNIAIDTPRSPAQGISAGAICGESGIWVLGGDYDVGCYIYNCYNTGKVFLRNGDFDGETAAGGLIGEGGDIRYSYNTGEVSAFGRCAEAGGICGYTQNISKCFNTGNISSSNSAGGIAGEIDDISDCYNTGNVLGRDIGGIASTVDGDIKNCYNTGDLNAQSDTVGGICGYFSNGNYVYNPEAKISNCYWNIDSTQTIRGESVDSKKGIAHVNIEKAEDTTFVLTTEQMQQQSSFAGFDFDNVWTIIDGVNNGMPVLQWLNCLPTSFPTPEGYSNNDYQKIVAFALQEDNLDELDYWSLTDPTTWKHVEWNNETPKRIIEIDIDSGQSTRGKLDLSDFTALEILDLSGGNEISEIDVSNCNSLVYVNLSDNSLASLSSFEDLESLGAINVAYNYLDLDSPEIQASIIKIQETINKNNGTHLWGDGWFEYAPQCTLPTFNCSTCQDSGEHCTACCTADPCNICNPPKTCPCPCCTTTSPENTTEPPPPSTAPDTTTPKAETTQPATTSPNATTTPSASSSPPDTTTPSSQEPDTTPYKDIFIDALSQNNPYVKLDRNTGTVIGKEALQAIRESGKTVQIELPNGLVITIDPATITDDAVSLDLNIDVIITNQATENDGVTIPANSVVIKPAAHGEFGFELSFTITAEELAESGLTANAAALFYVSDDGNISDCPKVTVNADGSVTIAISKASYYYLSGASTENGDTTTTPSTTANTNTAAPANTNSDTTATATTANTTKANSGNSDKNPGTGVTLCFTSVIIAAGALAISRKRKR